MTIVIHNLYGIKDGSKAYFRKQGEYCFDFVNAKKYASRLTKKECEKIMKGADWYCNMFNASHMTVEK